MLQHAVTYCYGCRILRLESIWPQPKYMTRSRPSLSNGFTIVELLIVVMVIAILGALALPAYRDNSNRARMSEVLLATAPCRLAVSDGWLRELSSPGAGNWGCEHSVGTSKYVDRVQTTHDGEIRIRVRGLNSELNGLHIYLKPYETATPPATGGGVFVAGKSVRAWKCGVDASDTASQALMNVLPGSCRELIDIRGTWSP
ncbi:pilin [Ramlibacter sp. AW1]|uniref:Pilin n=1 Tax=Ramlibacter aurantiacus TaxID=2801330 RepID=A0A937D3Z6_9BURK|nr:pilin [Ramlibacter aurantiacus]MBL0421205.1 pilin [Ramlibacter aurantiacus]